MNKLTKITNEISHVIKSLRSKILMVKEKIINIEYAIQWARLGIVNSVILNNNEIES